jgi:hypothetical protein
MGQYLVLLETSGNQRYIFATNKLRENVGASDLTYRVGKTWVWEAIHPKVPIDEQDESDPRVNPPIGPGVPIEIVLATSGKAYLRTDSEEAARAVIRKVTTTALKKAPGIDFSGVFVAINGESIHGAIKRAHQMLFERRGVNPGPEARFQRLPVVAECVTSGLPASSYDGSKSEPGPRSVQSLAKRRASGNGINRMRRIASKHSELGIVYSVSDLERHVEPDIDNLDAIARRSWLAVIHADGNGLGKVFLNFESLSGIKTPYEYIQKLRAFSKALDECTEKAFGIALKSLSKRCDENPLPVVPVVLGGDDVTVVMDGKYAIQFTIDFLTTFEKLTAADPLIADIMQKANKDGSKRVTACAGVAVMKSHFPFYSAYELADQLIRSAKDHNRAINQEKSSLSAFDFHILYDASGADLNRIRKSLEIDDTLLVARPYLISNDHSNPRGTAALAKRMLAIQTPDDDGRRAIPNSQLHNLRTALFMGRAAAEARLELIRNRYGESLQPLLVNDKLFWNEVTKNGTFARTALLDAIDLVEFWDSQEDVR